MAENAQYNISVPEKYEKDGEEKTAWTTVGTAFKNDKGTISLKIPANIAVSGDVVLFPKDDDE
ncbi:MAG: hypothetical protein NPIRA04_07270 [Nitrospirales bacterium]|nr:MAG: hypothetical protein NPIRA04_07270 [Nitrospirales bacterium]